MKEKVECYDRIIWGFILDCVFKKDFFEQVRFKKYLKDEKGLVILEVIIKIFQVEGITEFVKKNVRGWIVVNGEGNKVSEG